jgi:hypothetical protein
MLHPFITEELVRDRARLLAARSARTAAPASWRAGRVRARRAILPGLRLRLAGLREPPCVEGC